MYGDKWERAYNEDQTSKTEVTSDTQPETAVITPTQTSGVSASGIEAAQTAFGNALMGFVYSIADDFVKGSFTIMGTEANVTTGPDGKSRTINYSIHARDIDPFKPDYVITTLLISGGFYIGLIFIVVLGSRLILIYSINDPIGFNDYRRALTGEERPYSLNTARFASYLTIADPVIAFFLIFLGIYSHNVVVSGLSANSIDLMNIASDSLPTWIMTGISLYGSAIQSVLGEFGIYIIVALVFIRGVISSLLLMFGALKLSAYINVVVFGTFFLFLMMDVINILGFSAGIATSASTGRSIFVLIGTLVGSFINFLLLATIAVFSAVIVKNSLRV
jgi:hypothetical protein